MQDSLDGAAVRKKRKLKLAEEVTRIGPADGNAMDAAGLSLIPLPDMIDSGTIEVEIKEEGVSRTVEKGRRRRAKLDTQASAILVAPPVTSDVGLLTKTHPAPVMDKEQVFMAIGRPLSKNRSCDPISVDNIDVVDDWIVEKSELLSSTGEDSSWMALNQPMASGPLSQYPKDEDAEAFISGLDLEVIQGAGREAEDDDDCKEEDDTHDGTSFS
ncbi:hypothetical protein J5N97_006159 [Dioscorea zingiberensis]|uniref:Uncharacterized protein n=1 Tax=Dioscorea zingiberensis TaxID=325984 RepID=A0A9D5DBE9_9LILI|nr:hypothetical protein J5N97_006159 [Dioscorea zingiberensis]